MTSRNVKIRKLMRNVQQELLPETLQKNVCALHLLWETFQIPHRWFVKRFNILKWSLLFQETCSPEGNYCSANVKVDTTECKIPCRGIYADVKKLPTEHSKDESHLIFMERYKKYKRFFEPNPGYTQFRNV